MSEFHCKNGHLIVGGLRCQICGALVETMDGKSAHEIELEERYEASKEWRTEEEEDEYEEEE